ncbi:Pyridoxine/pyridoxamine 5'-phosphate oxidase [wastewater metagenome]|uniref:Pyridoxine/pyridoxamine 5'-phosphate oxidase n=2 Tax=unclassified sequences TaxID=12908 RepID=A0A5B8RAL8_9ZZZZ|nr:MULTISPECIES: pyridoxamine 5'-phosphate oxidase [Arhodomonas]QEA04988.1 pyridoxine/pyridoxamine 5'-phosphate oxidase [uncultured organism]
MSDKTFERALAQFREWFDRARAHEAVGEPTAMTLATAGADGRPSARIVLLKQVDEDGFVFYTNTRSRKGRQLAENPVAALTFFWQPLLAQVLVEGPVKPVTDAEADAYFASRPRLSQIGAWASHQSEPLTTRAELDERVRHYEERYPDGEVPRPPHWSGYRLVPEMIEFWSGRNGRLHHRERFWCEDSAWHHTLLNP